MPRGALRDRLVEDAKTYFAQEGYELQSPTEYSMAGISIRTSYGRESTQPDFKVYDQQNPPVPVITLVGTATWKSQKLMIWTGVSKASNTGFFVITEEGILLYFTPCNTCPGFQSDLVAYVSPMSCVHDEHRALLTPPSRSVYSGPEELLELLHETLEEQLDEHGVPSVWAQTLTQIDGGIATFSDDLTSYLFSIRGVSARLGCTSSELRKALKEYGGTVAPIRLRRFRAIRRYWTLPIRKKRPESKKEVSEAVVDV